MVRCHDSADLHNAGGVTLGDGAKGKIVIDFLDDRCNPEEGISVVHRIASTDAFVAVGPTCSNVAEPLFGILQKKVGDSADTGLQFPILTDVAAKGGLSPRFPSGRSATCPAHSRCTNR